MSELVALFVFAAIQQHRERELERMQLEAERELAARRAEWEAQSARVEAVLEGVRLTAPQFVAPWERERAIRYLAPHLDEFRLRGALDGYEQAARPRCVCCGTLLDPDRELAPNPNAN